MALRVIIERRDSAFRTGVAWLRSLQPASDQERAAFAAPHAMLAAAWWLFLSSSHLLVEPCDDALRSLLTQPVICKAR